MAKLFIPLIAEFKGKKAFDQANKATGGLEKNVKRLGVSLASAFSARTLINFGKASIRASLQQQAEQDRLNQLLTVGVGATANQVAALNNQADALEKLGVVTAGNITQTQSQLATFNLQTSTIQALTPAILDYVTAEKGATATTEQFKQMTNGLAQALNGNFSSLTRVGFVIDENTKKQIKSGNESERAKAIIEVLNSTYKDFNKNLRATPAGQMQVLANAAEDAQTNIGTGLLDALALLAGEGNTIEPLAESMSEFSLYVSDAIVGTALLANKLKEIPGLGSQNPLSRNSFIINPTTTALAILKKGVDYVTQMGKEFREPGMGGYPSSALGPGYVDPDAAAIKKQQELAARREKDQKRLAANLLAAEKKRLTLAKAQLALGKASKTIDIERIGIEAALKGQISETDRLSLLLQKSILDENANLATQLADQLESAIKRQNDLRQLLLTTPEAPNPYRNWKVPQELLEYTARSLGVTPETIINAPETIQRPTTDAGSELLDALLAAEEARRKAEAAMASTGDVYVKVTLPDGTDVTGDARAELTNQALSGSFITVGGRGANTARFT